MALGEALMEEQAYRKGRHQWPSMLEYKSPTFLDVPEIETFIVETVDPEGPYGAKEAGQGPLLPVLPALVSAVHDALGVWVDEVPVTPEKVLRALDARARGGAARFGPKAFPAFEVGALVTLADAAAHPALVAAVPGYAEAAGLVSSPPLRNAGTIGGNLCVDTRCNYYDMTYEWRRSVGFCMKKDGDVCLVAPGSTRCWAVSSSDTAPVAIALGATVVLAGPEGEREVPVRDLYRNDGIDYLQKDRH